MWVAFHCAKIFGILGQLQEINGTLRPAWKFSGQSDPPPEVVLFDRSVRSDRNLHAVPFQKILVSSPTLLIINKNCSCNANDRLIRLKTLFQSSNVVPFSLHDDSTGFWMFGLATRKALLKTDHHHVDLGGIVCKPQKCFHNLTGISCM